MERLNRHICSAGEAMGEDAATLAFSVRDRRASARWYAKMLGFEVVLDSDELGWIELATPIQGVTVGFSEVEEPQTSGAVVPTFGVTDIEAVRAVNASFK